MGAKKIYTLQINGISKNITDTRTLREELDGLDSSLTRINKNNQNATQTSRQRSAAVSEEEKAAQKLADTQDKATRVITAGERAQALANQQVRERTQAISQQIRIENAAEGSIRQMSAQLTQLRTQYENLTRAQREDIAVGGDLLRQIQALDKEYKGLRESTGNFRDSVGNYEKATSGLGKLSEGIDNTSKSSMGLAQTMLATNQVMALFGDNSKENTQQAQQLQKILALLGVVQGINNNIFKSGIATTKAATIAEAVHTIQVRARAMAIALSTKNTIAATVAQKAFNLVAKANPYVLLATAILAVAAAAATYATNADEATVKSEKYKSSIDNVTFASKEARDAHDDLSRKIRDIQIDIDVATGKLSQYEAAILRVKNAGKDAIDQINNEETDALDEINDKYTGLGYTLNWLYLQGNIFKGKGPSDYLQAQLDEQDKMFADFNERRRKQREINAKEEEKTLTQTAADVKKKNEDINNENLEGLKGTLAKIQTERLREEQAAIDQNKIIAEANKTRNKDQQLALNDLSAINLKYDKKREEAIKSSNKTAADAGKAALDKQKTALEKELALIRKAEDDKTALIVNEFDRRREESRTKYERQREDLEKQLAEDKTLTAKGQEAIRNIISNINAHWEAEDKKTHEDELKYREQKEKEAEAKRKELLDKRIADSDRRNSLLLSGLDIALEQAQQKIGEVVSRNKGGLELINVEKTKENYTKANDALDEYIKGLNSRLDKLKQDHDNNLIQIGIEFGYDSDEYEEELQKYAQANLQLNNDLKDANKQREANNKASNEIIADYFKDLFEKIGKYAEAASMAISSVMDTFNMSLEMQIESLNEQLESVTERYEEVKELREESTERVEELEQRLRDATGGTAEALKEQLQSEMHNRAELEREEARLAKEKEKREAEIAKKEKQMKRNNLLSNIAQAVASTAFAVVQALGLVFPLNLAVAAIVGAMGAAQVGLMTKQLTKMEDGGLITGPSHANGGARIQGTNIEVEGGEYVVNKASTTANTKLIDFINNSRSTVTAADLVGVIPGEAGTPVIVNEITQNNEDRILEAIENINLSPTVAVTDIMNAQDTVVNVRDLAGF